MDTTISSPKKNKLIFVIDDANWHNILTKKMLSDRGYKVVTFTDGYSLLENLKEKKPHLIISDINMPELDGIELCSRIKKLPHCKEIPVMYVTSLSQKEVDSRKNGNCAIGCMQKPLFKQMFLDTVAQKM